MTPAGHSKHSLDLPIGLSYRPRDESVVSSLHCMNDPNRRGHMASYIGRRKFLATLGGAAVGWPLAVRAQQPSLPVIGILAVAAPEANAIRLSAFREGLRMAGYIEGQNVKI